jgi:parallel beta-helix repeat protein
MKTDFVKKGLVIGMILLFIGSNVVSGLNIQLKNTTITMISGRGNTLYVGGTGEGNYSKIQDAIDNATDDDTVFVYDDLSPYYEHVVVDKSINLVGEDKDATVIDGNYIGTVVSITTHEVNISGFTIQNSAYGCDYGGITIHSNHTIIKDNTIRSNSEYGFDISCGSSYNNTIIDNNISSSDTGIILGYSSSNNITGNNVSNNNYGIILSDSTSNNIIINNKINSNFCGGIALSGYYRPCTNNIIKGNNISSNNFDGFYGGIHIEYSSNNIITSNNIISNYDNGIYLYQSGSNTITDNNIISNEGPGIHYLSGNNNIITGNNISSNNNDGIFMSSNYDNNITSNIISLNKGRGIYLCSSSNTITDNDIISNNDDAIYLVSGGNTITDNDIISNNGNGITLWSDSNIITGNSIISNSGYGAKFEVSSNNNLIYHNNFIDNTHNAYDKCTNIWDDGYPSGGNFWSDYNGTDSNGDGIGDTPYPILGGDNEDRYPLGNFPPDAPIIDGLTHGKVGVEYNYNFSLSDPDDDLMYLRVDWGNGTSSPWQGPYDSDTTVKLNHTWNQKGTFAIKAQVKDIFDAESDWATFEVTISKIKAINYNTLFSNLVEKFPLLQKLIRYY